MFIYLDRMRVEACILWLSFWLLPDLLPSIAATNSTKFGGIDESWVDRDMKSKSHQINRMFMGTLSLQISRIFYLKGKLKNPKILGNCPENPRESYSSRKNSAKVRELPGIPNRGNTRNKPW